jgi:hypothetical protein
MRQAFATIQQMEKEQIIIDDIWPFTLLNKTFLYGQTNYR